MSGYVYPGTKGDFYYEFGGLPGKTWTTGKIFAVFIIVVIVLIIITAIGFLLAKTQTSFSDHTGLYNLDLLTSLDVSTTKCCVPPGAPAPIQDYLYDTTSGITYSRQVPPNINVVCATFPNPSACIAANTDSSGKIIPVATFRAKPYYTFEDDLFIGCGSVATCT